MPVHPRIRAVSITAAVATALSLGVAGVAYASDDGAPAKKCADFDSILDAQAALDLDKVTLLGLDIELGGLKDGIACDLPEPRHEDDKDDADDPSCDDFDNQADAQEALDDDADLAEFIDRDGDGVACESLLDDDDASNDDDDSDSDSDDDKKSKDDDDDDTQVKVKPKGGVDTGGFPLA